MTIASEIQRINNNIASAYTACEGKGATLPQTQNSANLADCIDSISIGGGGTEPTLASLTITPSTTAQTITPPSGTDGYNTINVSAVTASIDNNLTAGNIKSGVEILGIQGTYEGSGGGGSGILEELVEDIVDGNNPISTTSLQAIENEMAGIIPYSTSISKTITASGTYYAVDDNANGYSSVTVDLSNTAGTRSVYDNINVPFNCQIPSLTIAQAISGFNLINRGTNVLDDLYNPYAQSHITFGDSVGDVRPIFLGESCKIAGRSYRNTFLLANATSTDDTTFDGKYSFATYNGSLDEFQYVTNTGGIISNIRIQYDTEKIWNFGALKKISLQGEISVAYGNEVEVILFPNLEEASLQNAFYHFTQLKYISFPKLKTINTARALGGSTTLGTFNGSQITELRFPSLNSGSFGSVTNQFANMLRGVSNCKVHFPTNLQSVIGSWSDVIAGFGGINTTVLFDLPSTATT